MTKKGTNVVVYFASNTTIDAMRLKEGREPLGSAQNRSNSDMEEILRLRSASVYDVRIHSDDADERRRLRTSGMGP